MPPYYIIKTTIINISKEAQLRYFKDIKKFIKDKAVFCGIDVHKNHWNLCFVCDGEVVEKVRIASKYIMLKAVLVNYSGARKMQLVYEAGFCGFWLYRKLTKDGYNCKVTPPSKTPKSGDLVKTDNRDSETLAFYLAAGLLKSVYVPPEAVESDRRVIRRRRQLRKQQTSAKNQINSFLNLHDLEMPETIKQRWTNHFMDWLESLEFEHESDKFTLASLIKNYRRIRQDLLEVTQFIRQLARTPKYQKSYKHLTSLRGVGLITAMTFLLEIFDFKRFKTEAHFASYLGITPAQFSSGDHIRLGHITRQGNAHLRYVLIESAWTVIRHDPHLRAKYDRIRARGTNGKKAIVAVARSLAIRLRRCLLDDSDYVIGVC
jgi:transposase